MNVKIEKWYTFGRGKKHLKKNKDCPLLRFECFEHAKFVVNEKYSKNNYDNPNYYVSL
jgi:hypothetical protein